MKKYLLVAFFATVITLALIEFGLRFVGIGPFNAEAIAQKYYSTPTGCYLPDSNYMLRLNDGKYIITVNGGLKFSANHMNGTRVTTGAAEETSAAAHKIYAFGCSFTYGTGVNDSNTYSSFLQADLNHAIVKNFGFPGASNLLSMLQLKECLAQRDTPDIVLLSCSKLHYERNVFSPKYRYALYNGAQVLFARILKDEKTGNKQYAIDSISKSFRYSYGELVDDKLTIKNVPVVLAYKPFPLRNKFALCMALDVLLNQQFAKNNEENEKAVTAKIIEEFIGLCKKTGVKLIVHDFNYEDNSKFVADICAREHVVFVCKNIDWSKGLDNSPYDSHPNRKGQYEIYKMLAEPVKLMLKE